MAPDGPSIPLEGALSAEIERLVGAATFEHWFRDAAIQIDQDCVTIRVKNAFLLSWMQHRFRSVVRAAACNVLGPSADVRFEAPHSPSSAGQSSASPSPSAAPAPNTPPSPSSEPNVAAASASSTLRTGTANGATHQPTRRPTTRNPSAHATPLAALTREAVRNVERSVKPAAANPAAPKSSPIAPKGRRFADFVDFVKGPCNDLALTAALQVCQSPGTRYNPLVMCGGVGTGKTHLLEAVYRQIRSRHPSYHLQFLSAESFANCFTQALRDRSLPSFRQRFRNVDVFLVDDVDFLDGKRVIQEEFLHTVKQLESHERQIVLTCDRHPRLLTKSSEELVTRCLSGIVCRIEAPNLETRRTIVARKASRMSVNLSEEALDFVAQRFGGSVRELEGALNGLESYAIATGKPVGLSMARHFLADVQRDCLRVVRLPEVELTVCRFFGLEPQDIRSTRRSRSVSQPRMLAMYLARKLTHAAYSEIGQYFGGRNHSTVMSAEKRVREMLTSEAKVRVASQTVNLRDLMASLEQQLMTG
jgi:chromosomal replication initiator protein